MDLLNAMNSAKAGLSSNPNLNQAKNIQFTGNDIITYNDQIGILCPFETDFEASINFNDLEKVISKTTQDEIEMNIAENELRISAKGTKAGLLLSAADELNEKIDSMIDQMPNDNNELEWMPLSDDFMNGITLCSPAASKSISQGILACVYTNGKHIICSDNRRVAIFELKEKMDTSFLITASVVSELCKFKFTEFCVSQTWVYFITESNFIFCVRKVLGEKLDFYLTLLNDFKGSGVTPPDNLKDIVNSAAVMAADDADREMHISVENGKIVCSTQNERGWVEKWTDENVSKINNVELNVSATHLAQILDMPELTMNIGQSKSLFESGSFKYILLHRG